MSSPIPITLHTLLFCHSSTSSNPNPSFALSESQNPSQTSTNHPIPTSYDPYASIHRSFHNFHNSSFQPPNLLPDPYPPQTSTHPFNRPTSQPPPPPPPVLQMTPSVLFAALSDPIKD